jgi:hypothetical protein
VLSLTSHLPEDREIESAETKLFYRFVSGLRCHAVERKCTIRELLPYSTLRNCEPSQNVNMYRPGYVTRPTCDQVILLTTNNFPFVRRCASPQITAFKEPNGGGFLVTFCPAR